MAVGADETNGERIWRRRDGPAQLLPTDVVVSVVVLAGWAGWHAFFSSHDRAIAGGGGGTGGNERAEEEIGLGRRLLGSPEDVDTTVAGRVDLNTFRYSHDTRITISESGTGDIASTDGESGIGHLLRFFEDVDTRITGRTGMYTLRCSRDGRIIISDGGTGGRKRAEGERDLGRIIDRHHGVRDAVMAVGGRLLGLGLVFVEDVAVRLVSSVLPSSVHTGALQRVLLALAWAFGEGLLVTLNLANGVRR